MRPITDLQKAHQAFTDKDYARTDKIAREVLETNPKAHKAYQLLSMSARAQNDWAGAEAHIKRALEIDPDDAECLNSYGNILSLTSRGLDARAAYEKALTVAPNYVPPAISLGQLCLREKDPVAAIEVFRAALSHTPNHRGLAVGLLYALKDAQQTDAAQALLKQLPPGPDLALPSGQIAAMNHQKPLAEAGFKAAMSNPQTADAGFRNLVQMTVVSDGADAAVAQIDEVIEAAPDAGGFYLSAADMLADMGRYDDGLAMLDKAVAKFGNQPEITSVRAKLFIEAGDGAAAFELAEGAICARPGDLGLLSHIVRAGLMTERFDLALQATKAAQERQPNNQFWLACEGTALRALGQDEAYAALNDRDFISSYDLETPPEYNTQAEFLAQLKAALVARHPKGGHPLGLSARGGTQTMRDLRFADDRVIQDFFQALNAPITDFIARMPDDESHPLFRRKRDSYRLTGAWSIALSGGGFHVNHVHPEGWISSSFYVDVPDGIYADPTKGGSIKFGEPPFTVPHKGGAMGYDHIITPRAGQLVLFPSYVWHGTVPIKDGASRMTLPFDAVPA